jgi:hypothetical protein
MGAYRHGHHLFNYPGFKTASVSSADLAAEIPRRFSRSASKLLGMT